MVQWLRLHAPNVGGLGSIPGQETRFHKLQLRVWKPQLKKNKKQTNKQTHMLQLRLIAAKKQNQTQKFYYVIFHY